MAEKRTWDYWLFAIATLIFGGITAWSTFFPLGPGPRLSVVTDYGPFRLPKPFLDSVEQLGWLKEEPAANQEPVKQDGNLEIKLILDSGKAAGKVLAIEYGTLKGMMEVSIKNEGDREANEVSLQCDYDGYYLVDRIDGTKESKKFQKTFELGDIKQDEVVSVSLWTKQEIDPSSKILIAHSLGKLSTQVEKSEDSSFGFKGFIIQAFFTALFAVMGVLFALNRFFYSVAKSSSRAGLYSARKQVEAYNSVRTALDKSGFSSVEINPVIDDIGKLGIILNDSEPFGDINAILEAIKAAEDGNLESLESECKNRGVLDV